MLTPIHPELYESERGARIEYSPTKITHTLGDRGLDIPWFIKIRGARPVHIDVLLESNARYNSHPFDVISREERRAIESELREFFAVALRVEKVRFIASQTTGISFAKYLWRIRNWLGRICKSERLTRKETGRDEGGFRLVTDTLAQNSEGTTVRLFGDLYLRYEREGRTVDFLRSVNPEYNGGYPHVVYIEYPVCWDTSEGKVPLTDRELLEMFVDITLCMLLWKLPLAFHESTTRDLQRMAKRFNKLLNKGREEKARELIDGEWIN